MEITKLKGIGGKMAEKFADKGITTIEQLFVIPPPKIAEMLNIDNEASRGLFQKAREFYYKENNRFKTGSQKKKDDESLEKISTGTRALDTFFTGGIECGATTEIYGEFGCGKTQFCHTMCVRVQLSKEKGGLGGKAVYLDSEGTFEPTRIESIAKAIDEDPEKMLENIIHVEAHNSADQYYLLLQIENKLVEDKDIKLIIIDSATGLFRQDYSGRGMLSERQKYMDEFLSLASNMANFHKVAIVWTNQVMVNPGVFYGDPITAIGGTIIAHKSTYRVYFKKSGAYRMAKMVDSPKHGQTEVMFGLSESGVVDYEEAERLEKERKAKKLKAKKESLKEESKDDDDSE